MMKINKKTIVKDFTDTIAKNYGKSVDEANDYEKYVSLCKLVRYYSMLNLKETRTYVKNNDIKNVYYFSMEFLIGRLLRSNLHNLGLYDFVKDGLADLDIDLALLEEMEVDAGLGNGGLGRLAACFLDSIASCNYSGSGFTIRYRNGFFEQKFEAGYQIEEPSAWLKDSYPWEVRKSSFHDVKFYGRVESYEENGKTKYHTVDSYDVRAVAYDIPVVGANTKVTNKLRMFDALTTEAVPSNKDYKTYESEVRDITSQLYPDDTTEYGKELRLKQQYFFTSAGLQTALKYHLNTHNTLDNFHEYNVLQINDTHPAILVAEFMRVLIDENDYTWDDAWHIVTSSCAYTNHTILAEALEKWPQQLFKNLLPRIYMIIEEINQLFCKELFEKQYSLEKISKMAIISYEQIHMAHLAIVGSFSVNGVARLHTDILIEDEMKDWYNLYPNKFNNKTNGITHRRWFEYCNQELASYVTRKVGNDYLTNPIDGFKKLLTLQDDKEVLEELANIKLAKKKQLAAYILEHEGIEIDPNSIFDVQIKRLHAYKRQLLNALHICYLYSELKNNEEFRNNFYPQTFIFGAKAAPGYAFAKNVIKFINTISEVINNDSETNNLLKVVFVTNYNTSYAELIIPATDISEQISTAGYEASGTGNMKFMMNGALTLGTMDGANVEIFEQVGSENIEIFGMSKDEVKNLQNSNVYNANDKRASDSRLDKIFTQLENIDFDIDNIHENEFGAILHNIFAENDPYYVLEDFESYRVAQSNLNKQYKNTLEWQKKCLVNIAMSGFFSSDRTIEDYVKEIWKLQKLDL